MSKINRNQALPGITSEETRILNFITDKFMREGFYKSSMDSLAAELQVSKKTIYAGNWQ
jgi:hypothetical protein